MNEYEVARAAGRNRGTRDRVLDWDKAAALINERQAGTAEAGIDADWKSTGRTILDDGRPVDLDPFWLASCWAVPHLILDGQASVPCWRWQDEASWDASAFWPPSALAVLHGPVTGQDFWTGYTRTLARIRTERPSTVDAVAVILNDFQRPSAGVASFTNLAGDRLSDALADAGWDMRFLEDDCAWEGHLPGTGETLHHTGGNIYPGRYADTSA